MKITKTLLAGMIATFCCSIGSAQIIYSNSFSGGAVNINGVAPTYVNPNASSFGGSLTAAFDVVSNAPTAGVGFAAYQNGTLGAGGNSVLLPFTPLSGYTYTLTASLTFASIPPGSGWGALGYGLNFPTSNTAGDARFNQAGVSGNPWALLNYAAQGGGAQLWKSRSGTPVGGMANLMTAINTPYTINFVLDTTAANWTTALYVAGTFVTNYTYTGSVAIHSIGYGQTTTTAGAYQWNYLTLTATPVPEPSTLALAGLGFLGACILGRRIKK